MAKARSESPSGGKLVDTWYYEYEGLVEEAPRDDEEEPRQHVAAKKVAVELRIHKKFKGDTPPLAAKEVWFSVSSKDADFSLEGKDIEALRAAMWEHLDKKYAVQWTDYFLVEVEHRGPYEGLGTGLSFGYKDVKKGVAWDGTLLMKSWKFRQFMIEPWPGEFRNKQGRVLACIPASEFNRDALQEFQSRVDALRDRLADYLKPDMIVKTLANLNGVAFLPAPPHVDEFCDSTHPVSRLNCCKLTDHLGRHIHGDIEWEDNDGTDSR